MVDNIQRMTEAFKSWSTTTFGSVKAKKKRCLAGLEGIQRKLMTRYDNDLIKLEKKVREQLNETLV